MLWRMLALAALGAAPILYFKPYSLTWFAGGTLLMLVLEARVLQAHFHRLYRLRYLRNQPQLALAELRPWRLILPAEQYQLLRAELLVHAEQFSLVDRLLASPSTSEWLRHHVRYVLARHREDHPQALSEITQVVETAQTAEQVATSQGEMARFLAEHYPERLPEAFRLLDTCRPHFAGKPGMEEVLRGIEGCLMIAAGSEEGGPILDEVLESLKQQLPSSPQLAPVVADFYRWRARGQWARGHDEQARIDLLRARETVFLPTVHQRLDEDLARLQRREPLLPEPDAATRDYLASRATV